MAKLPKCLMNPMWSKALILPVLLGVLLFSCDSNELNQTCTSIFATSTVTIVEENSGNPVESMEITITKQEDDEKLDICKDLSCSDPPITQPGTYLIFHDGFKNDIDPDGEEIIVEGTKGDSISFSQEYTFGHDGCHIQKFAGPDTIFVSVGDD